MTRAGPCLTVAHALQVYGMYVIDNSGREKVMMEYEGTAHWNGVVDASTPSPIPLSAFKLLDLPGQAADLAFLGSGTVSPWPSFP